MFSAAVAALAYMGFAATKPMPSPLGLDVPSPGLLALAGLVGAWGLFFLLMGLFFVSIR